MTDPVADMLNQIKNAQAARHATAEIPFSNLKYNIAQLLSKSGFIGKVEKKGKKSIEVVLKYEDKNPVISGIKRVSRPGQRIYTDFRKIKKIKGGYGLSIISTSKGLMTDKDAKRQKIGGEILCELW